MTEPLRERFAKECPGAFFLAADSPDELQDYLRQEKLLTADESILAISPAGEGNMNLTLRLDTGKRRFILKQARPWVEKYPQLAAPWDRVLQEAKFYEWTAPLPAVAARMPRVLGLDAISRIFCLEDLGTGGDFSSLYSGARLSEADLEALAAFLSELHAANLTPDLPNRELRQLNHAHLFIIPLDPRNGLDLETITPGLTAAAALLQNDGNVSRRVTELGEIYLADGPTLLHGDFYPGSWLRTANGLRVIDPEFAYFGRAEFELGVLRAHLLLTEHPESAWEHFQEKYRAPVGFDSALAEGFAGIETMRRLIGYAQLPLRADLAQKTAWLEHSRKWILRSRT